MKTLIILNDLESDLKYLIVKGDYSKFHDVCVNSTNQTGYEDEFCKFVWDKNGNRNHIWSSDKKLIEEKQWDKIAICTFIP